MKFGSQEIRRIPLSYGFDIMIDYYFILSRRTRLTDGQTDIDRKIVTKTVKRHLNWGD